MTGSRRNEAVRAQSQLTDVFVSSSIGSSPPGCDGPFCFAFRSFAWPLSTFTICFRFSHKTPEVSLAWFNRTCFSRSSRNRAPRELMRRSSARVCAFLWASPILSMAHIISGNFARVGDRISLKRLRTRPPVYVFHLPCSLRQLSKPKVTSC